MWLVEVAICLGFGGIYWSVAPISVAVSVAISILGEIRHIVEIIPYAPELAVSFG